jgi:hypothetical protein
MAMEFPTLAATLLTGINSVLLTILVGVWVSNYRQFQTPMVLGLLGFSTVLLVENLIALAFLSSNMRMLYSMDPLVGQVVLGMRFLELIAVGFLTYATLK